MKTLRTGGNPVEANVELIDPNSPLSQIEDKARTVWKLAGDMSGAYRELVDMIAKAKDIHPKKIRGALDRAGWDAPSVSRFCRVAFASEPVVAAYLKGELGWRVALKVAREEKPQKKSERQKEKAARDRVIVAAAKVGKSFIANEGTFLVVVIAADTTGQKEGSAYTVNVGKQKVTIV